VSNALVAHLLLIDQTHCNETEVCTEVFTAHGWREDEEREREERKEEAIKGPLKDSRAGWEQKGEDRSAGWCVMVENECER
jgi:hypothetical protein